jgi:TetR/AcrR family transcriptional repressor of nem operon
MRETNTRDLLIQEGLRSFLAYGYDGVGIGPVLSAVNVPKGSFYHFFRSKEDFAIAVLEAYVARYASFRESLKTGNARPPLSRLRSHFDALEKELVADFPAGGCLYGVLSQTITTLGPVLRKRLQESFQIWQESILHVLLQAQEVGDLDPAINAEEAAAFLIDAYEGALIRMKSEGVACTFRRFKRFALEPLLAQTPRAAPASVHGKTAARRRKKVGSPKNTSEKPSNRSVGTRR